jgi:hypothetical protein
MSGINDDAAKRLGAERDDVEISPAQPDDATRIDDDDAHARLPADGPPHVKPDHSGRMTH